MVLGGPLIKVFLGSIFGIVLAVGFGLWLVTPFVNEHVISVEKLVPGPDKEALLLRWALLIHLPFYTIIGGLSGAAVALRWHLKSLVSRSATSPDPRN